MDKKMLIRMLGLTALATSLGTAPLAAEARPGHGHGPGKMLDRALDSLDLTDDQEDRIDAIRARLREDLKELRPDARDLERGPGALLTDESITREQARARVDQRMEAQKQVAYRVADAMLEIRDVLTPEQRDELAKKFAEKRERMEKKRKK